MVSKWGNILEIILLILVIIIFIKIFSGCSSTINPDYNDLIGTWANNNVIIEFSNGCSFTMYQNDIKITKEGTYNLSGDFVTLSYYDYYLNWSYNDTISTIGMSPRRHRNCKGV